MERVAGQHNWSIRTIAGMNLYYTNGLWSDGFDDLLIR